MFKFLFDKDAWQEIFDSIKKSKLRTVITVIGVWWGVLLYITLLGASKGLENGMEREFRNMATNSIFLWSSRTSVPYDGFQRGRRVRLKQKDCEAIRKQVPNVEYAVPRNVQGVFGGGPAQVIRKTKVRSYKLFGDYPFVDKVSKVKLLKGRFLNNSDINETKKVCVIGEAIVDELFEKDDEPIGDFIEINGSYFKIVGLYKQKAGSFEGDGSIYIPFTTFSRINNTADNISWMVIAAKKDADIKKVEEDVKALLKRRHRVHPEDKQGFGAFNFGEMFKKITGFVKGIKFLTWFVGIATLLAGVIAIGSILLITVKERTKEIGIRRALGAKPIDIKRQIILESLFLTLIAGIIGFICGGGLLMLADKFMAGSDGALPFVNPTVNIPTALGAILVIVVLGCLIGMIPAQRAINIKPIEALREE